MRTRCLNKNTTDYIRYGGRGISICDRWSTFENFLADMGERPAGTTLDRIDVNGPYAPGNCRWANDAVQQSNRRNTKLLTAFGQTWPIKRWAAEFKMDSRTIKSRISDGLSLEKILIEKINNTSA